MHALRIAFILGSHVMALGLAVYTTHTSGVPVHILLYAFLIDYVLRLLTIRQLHAELASGQHTWLTDLAPYVMRLPAPRQKSHPVTDGEGGPPAPMRKYFIVMAAMAMFAFVLVNVGADKELHLPAAAGVDDLQWALLIGAIYWANSLLTRTIVLHPGETVNRNLGYNTKEVTILALAVLTGGAVVGVRQNMGLGPSGWTVMGPLLVFRFVYDVFASLGTASSRTPRFPSAPVPE